MRKEQLNLDHLSMIKSYLQPQKSKEVMLNQMIQSNLFMNGKKEFDYESKILTACIEFIRTVSIEEIQQLDFSEVLDDEEEVVE